MRPAHIHAGISAQQYHELQHALHHQWQPATRAVVVVLSADRMPPAEIGALLHYSPTTVCRWIARHDIEGLAGLTDRPRSGRPQANALLKLSVARLA